MIYTETILGRCRISLTRCPVRGTPTLLTKTNEVTMSKENEQLVEALKNLSNMLGQLLPTNDGKGVVIVEDKAKAVVGIPKVVPTEVDMPEVATPEAIEELAFQCGYLDVFVKEACKRWKKVTAMRARHAYNEVRDRLITSGKWKTRPSNARRNKVVSATQDGKSVIPEVAQPRTGEGERNPLCFPEKDMIHAPTGSGKTTALINAINARLNSSGSVFAPVSSTGQVTPEFELSAICAEAKALCEKDESIEAIKVIHAKAGFGLLDAKMWVDYIRGKVDKEPMGVTVARQDYIRRRLMENRATLDQQVQTFRKDIIKKEMDPEAGKVLAQKKADIAGDNAPMLVQVARRIARELAVNGPITVDDVTRVMSERYNVLPKAGSKGKDRHSWKGSIFNKTEWEYVGDIPSQQKSAHARPVGLWALKSWLGDNTLNGKNTHVSSFVLSRLHEDFKRKFPGVALDKCNCYIGEDRLSEEIKSTILKGGNKLYATPVTFIQGAVGAIMTLPHATVPFVTK